MARRAVEPLAAGIRQATEDATGADLAPTRIHRASPLPAAVGARAFTYGMRIFLGPGQDDALAHEARHVAQQRLGRVRTERLCGRPRREHRPGAGA